MPAKEKKTKNKKVYLLIPFYEGMPEGYHDENEKYLLDVARAFFRDPNLEGVTGTYEVGKTHAQTVTILKTCVKRMLECEYVVRVGAWQSEWPREFYTLDAICENVYAPENRVNIDGSYLPNTVDIREFITVCGRD